jgi:hypothetical protein
MKNYPNILRVLLALVIGLAVAAKPALAQDGSRVLAELQETERVLEQAREIVGHALGPRPSNVLTGAASLQQEAWSSFRAGRLFRAFEQTMGARRSALRAADITKSQLRLLDRVRHVLAANDDLVGRAREAVAATASPEAQRLLDAGLAQLARGRRSFEDTEYRQAVRHSLFGRDLLLRAVRIAEGGRALTKARVEEELARTEEFLSEAQGSSPEGPDAEKRLREARRLQERADDQLREGRLEAARRLTVRARDAVLDVLQNQSETIDAAELTAAIERVNDRLHAIQSELDGSANSEASKLVVAATSHLERALAAQRAGKDGEALAEAQVASSLVGQAENLLR